MLCEADKANHMHAQCSNINVACKQSSFSSMLEVSPQTNILFCILGPEVTRKVSEKIETMFLETSHHPEERDVRAVL